MITIRKNGHNMGLKRVRVKRIIGVNLVFIIGSKNFVFDVCRDGYKKLAAP